MIKEQVTKRDSPATLRVEIDGIDEGQEARLCRWCGRFSCVESILAYQARRYSLGFQMTAVTVIEVRINETYPNGELLPRMRSHVERHYHGRILGHSWLTGKTGWKPDIWREW